MLADRIDSVRLEELAVRQATQAGQLGRDQLPRLAVLLAEGTLPDLEAAVTFAPAEHGLARLELSLRGRLQLVCQRCLGPVDWPVELNASLTVVADDSEAALLEDPFESLVLAADGLRLEQIVEDEVLAAVPLAPRHGPEAACSGPAQVGGNGQESADETNRPFADLAAMLKAGQRRTD
jgi:uncharacterized protein